MHCALLSVRTQSLPSFLQFAVCVASHGFGGMPGASKERNNSTFLLWPLIKAALTLKAHNDSANQRIFPLPEENVTDCGSKTETKICQSV